MQFELMNFVANLKYMGLGMLGVFIVIGAIIGAIYLLNRSVNAVTNRQKSDDSQG
jgi:hypothetical protein